jgi:hypothetical protein
MKTDDARFDVFLSHNSDDKAAIEYLARRLQQADIGLRPFVDTWHLVPGNAWVKGLADALRQSATTAIFIGPSGISPWHNEEMQAALDRAVQSHDDFRVIPVLLPGAHQDSVPEFLRVRTWVDFRSGLDDAESLRRLVAGIKGEAYSGIEYRLPDEPAPYRGLLRFEPEHSRFFHGRDDESRRLLLKVQEKRFVAVVGNSGSGKSSLLRAGLAGSFGARRTSGPENWIVRVFTPGDDAIRALAEQVAALSDLAGRLSMVDGLRDRMANRKDGLRTALGTSVLGDRQVLLLVIDQFEDLFGPTSHDRHGTPRREADLFIANIVDAVQRGDGRIRVVIALRADHLETCLAFPDFRVLLEEGQLLLGPLSDAALREAIVKPAQDVGAFLEKGLVTAILRDVEEQAAVLPLLQQALYELWLDRRGPWLTLNSYEASGGVRGAIGRRAQTTYDGLSEQGKEIARRIFVRLTTLVEDEQQTRPRVVRRSVNRNELQFADARADDVSEVIEALSGPRARLVVAGENTIEIAHEALLRHWPTLHAWVQANLESYRIHGHLTGAALEWQRLTGDRGALYRGLRLDDARHWSERHSAEVNPLEREFIEASLRERERERAERSQAETARRFRVLSASLAALAVVAAVLGFVAVRQSQSAEQALALAEALRLSLLSKLNQDALVPSLLLAVESVSLAPQSSTPVGALTHNRLLEQLAYVGWAQSGTRESASSIDVSSNSGLMAAVTDHRLRLWDLDRPGSAPRPLADGEAVNEARFDPLGRWIAASTARAEVLLWQLPDVSATPMRLRTGTSATSGLAFSGDGSTLAALSEGAVHVWQLESLNAPPRVLPVHSEVNVIALSPDARLLAMGNEDLDSVSVWDLAAAKHAWSKRMAEDAGLWQVAFSPDGQRVAVGMSIGVRLFDAVTGRFVLQLTEVVRVFAFSRDSAWLIAPSRNDALLRVVELGTGGQDQLSRPTTNDVNRGRNLRALAISADGRWLAAATQDRGALVWPIDPARLTASACATAGRNFTAIEWNRFFLSEPCRPSCSNLPNSCTPER